jgi:hypothetical protein
MQSRLENMSPKQLILSCCGFIVMIAIVLGASFKAEEMLIYNMGDSFTCAHSFSEVSHNAF